MRPRLRKFVMASLSRAVSEAASAKARDEELTKLQRAHAHVWRGVEAEAAQARDSVALLQAEIGRLRMSTQPEAVAAKAKCAE